MEMELERISKQKELALALNQFFKIIYIDFGISKFNRKMSHWYKLTWDEFRTELENEKVKFNPCLLADWEDFFHTHKKKVLDIME